MRLHETIIRPEFRPLRLNAGKDLAFISDTQGNDLLELLAHTCAVAQHSNVPLTLGQVQEIKGRLHEKQYAARMTQLAGKAELLRAAMRSQNGLRCQYANAHLILKLSLPKDKPELQRLAATIIKVAEAAQSLNSESDAALKVVMINNCLVARNLLSERLKTVARIERELQSDATTGRARQALTEAFAELDKPASARKTDLQELDLRFIERLPNITMVRLAAAYREVDVNLQQARSALRDARQMRGMLHEEQFVRQLEAASENSGEQLALTARQKERRRYYQSQVSCLDWWTTRLVTSVEALKVALEDARLAHTIFADRPDIRDAMISNCLAAKALIEDVTDIHLVKFKTELTNDATDGQAILAFDEALAELSVDEELLATAKLTS